MPAFNIFKKKDEEKKKKPAKSETVEVEETKTEVSEQPIKLNFTPGAHKVLKSFYISEKASRIMAFNQYVFKVADDANKKEIEKTVEKLFNVKVKSVKVLNMPSKSRNVGRHSGTKPGFRKAIVVLEDGYSIEQAKA